MLGVVLNQAPQRRIIKKKIKSAKNFLQNVLEFCHEKILIFGGFVFV